MAESSGALGVLVEPDVPVPMRDGVVLRANVFRPDAPGRFPGLLSRTPYGKAASGQERLVRAGYAVVTQDTRGRYASDGAYIPFTEEQTGDGEDGYDSVEWLAQQPWCNGRVGTFGASYNAWMQWQLARLRPPHLVAMCATTIPVELTEVDWPGAFRPGRRIRWWFTTIAPNLRRRHGLPPPHTPEEANRIWTEIEQGSRLGHLPWSEICKYLPPGLAEYAESWLRHPNRRPWRFDLAHYEVTVPNLDFSGWYDHCNGSIGHLAGMQQHARTDLARSQTKLVLGPWNHGGFGLRKLGDIDFGPSAEVDMQDVMIRWFDHWLRGADNGVEEWPAVRYFVMGSGVWRTASTWPPPDTSEAVLHLRSEGGLTRDPPGDEEPDTYVYDPWDPTPTLWTPQLFTVPSDRRRLEYRTDILRYRTAPLDEALEIAGEPEVVLHIASTAPDTDFSARLCDEQPDGPALEICYGFVRCRHRDSFESEELLTPGEVTELRIRLGSTACRFAPGHRVRLEICSADFPNVDRNHNTGRNDLADAEMVAAEQSVFHSAVHPSRLLLPTVSDHDSSSDQ